MKKLRFVEDVLAMGFLGLIVLFLVGCPILHYFFLPQGGEEWAIEGPLSGSRMIGKWPQGYPESITRVVEIGYVGEPFGSQETVVCCFPVADVPQMKRYFQEKHYIGPHRNGQWPEGLPPGNMLLDFRNDPVPRDLKIPNKVSSTGYIYLQREGEQLPWAPVIIIDTARGISYYSKPGS